LRVWGAKKPVRSLSEIFGSNSRGGMRPFLDLQWSGRRGWSGEFRVGKKGWFSSLRRNNMLCFLSSFSSFHPTLRAIHEDMGTNLILEATNKAF
jgi:hypothetical protein